MIFGNCNPSEGGNVNISRDLRVLRSFGLKIPKLERDFGHQSSHLNYHIEGMFKKIMKLKKRKSLQGIKIWVGFESCGKQITTNDILIVKTYKMGQNCESLIQTTPP